MTNIINFSDYLCIDEQTGFIIDYDIVTVASVVVEIMNAMNTYEDDEYPDLEMELNPEIPEVYSALFSQGDIFSPTKDEHGYDCFEIRKSKMNHVLNTLIKFGYLAMVNEECKEGGQQ